MLTTHTCLPGLLGMKSVSTIELGVKTSSSNTKEIDSYGDPNWNHLDYQRASRGWPTHSWPSSVLENGGRSNSDTLSCGVSISTTVPSATPISLPMACHICSELASSKAPLYRIGPYQVLVRSDIKFIPADDGHNSENWNGLSTERGLMNVSPLTEDAWKEKYAYKEGNLWFYKSDQK